jgi:hypothetical protein
MTKLVFQKEFRSSRYKQKFMSHTWWFALIYKWNFNHCSGLGEN